MSALKVGGLFAGYGGVEIAVQSVFPSARPAWFSQYDPDGGKRQAPSRILAHHWPDVPNHGDITAIDWSAVEPVDVITGGSPCQDLSHAGKRAGMKAGTRSGLWASMCDAVDILRPRLVLWENVRGAYSAPAAPGPLESCEFCVGGADGKPPLRALGRVVGDLSELGYQSAWVGLRAADVGAPHGRFRVFVLAWPQSDPGALTWPQSDPGALLATPAASQGASLRAPREDGYVDLGRQIALLPTPRTSDTNGAGEQGEGGADLRTVVSLLPTPSVADVEGGRKSRSGDRSDELLLNGIAHQQRFGQYAPAIARWEALTRPAPAPTEPTGKNGAHRLSPAFVEFLMGLPAGWVTDVPGITRNDQLKALGNGVVPQQAAEAIRWLTATAARELNLTRKAVA